ncbi:MAG TPA: DUF2252 family protein [Steroidobacteraceae bacterium]|nr:DUF2252 family protein [Steroidobacteraceae bacterium]
MAREHKSTITPALRARTLDARRKLKMAGSAHAYVRGSTVQFYRWLEGRGKHAVPKGPPVWICGDCHAGNLGPLAAPDGKVHVQIRDLDQTVIGNPNHDLIRLALSLSSAARGSDLPGVTTARMLEQMMIGYQRALRGPRAQNQIESDKPECIKVVTRRATARTWKHLARERLEDVKPTIPRGERYWSLTKNESRAIHVLFENGEVRKLVTSLRSRPDDSTIEVLDAAYWMKGCSSLGRLRLAVLLRVCTGKKRDDEFCLIDIKEATPAAAPRATRAVMPRDHARRVVEGAKHLSPALGDRMMASKLLERSVVIRELMPQDLKLEIDQLSRKEAVNSARYLAEVVGKAHSRQMDASTRREFAASFNLRQGARLNAPSWLWSSVVELASAHEAAYLEHCRLYAMGDGQ